MPFSFKTNEKKKKRKKTNYVRIFCRHKQVIFLMNRRDGDDGAR
jgi:hypothetical protein